jgi:hypothetical protein
LRTVRRSNSLSFRPDQRIRWTVRTKCRGSSRASADGTFSSSRTRNGQ